MAVAFGKEFEKEIDGEMRYENERSYRLQRLSYPKELHEPYGGIDREPLSS